MEQEPRRRRRFRSGEPTTPAVPDAVEPDVLAATADIHDPEPLTRPHRAGSDDLPDRDAERGLRVLVGAGNSQITLAAAMRARDAARPTDDDIAASEANLAIVRRGWVPREQLPRTGSDHPPRG